MSANTSIREGGKGRSFGPVKCLMVEGDNGEFYQWYPEVDRALDSLSVNKNGVYQAGKYGVYGWNRVSVNVAQGDRVTGRDPETGQEVTVTSDPETGELVETVVPVEIRVIEPPTNPYGVYVDGQTITKDGMVVKAYDANGDEMQIVPIGEITINPTLAVYDETTDTGEYTLDDTSVLQHPNAYNLPLVTSGVLGFTFFDTFNTGIACNAGKLLALNGVSKCFSETPTTITRTDINTATQQTSTYTNAVGTPVQTRISGKTVYYNDSGWDVFTSDHTSIVGVNNTTNGTISMADIATILFDGVQQKGQGSDQTITVSWPRPGDGAILETTFDILVGPRGGQGDD